MASIEAHGSSWKVRFSDQQKKRRKLSVGKCGKKAALSAANHVQALVNAVIGGRQPDANHIRWAASQQRRIQAKLAEWGLFQSEAPEQPDEAQIRTLRDLFEAYSESRKGVKEATRYLWGRSYNYLCEHFTALKPIDRITKQDAKNFREYMLTKPSRKKRMGEDAAPTFSENTIRKTLAHARMFFEYAIDSEWLDRNPFRQRSLKVTVGAKSKQYIALETLEAALRVVPSAEWRAVLLMARICGMRVQSEGPLLEWSHVDWELGVLTVTDIKRTRNHQPRYRRCPLFRSCGPSSPNCTKQRRRGRGSSWRALWRSPPTGEPH